MQNSSHWKSGAKAFLASSVQKDDIVSMHKKLFKNAKYPYAKSIKETLIDEVLSKIKSPSDLCSKQEVTIQILRKYLVKRGMENYEVDMAKSDVHAAVCAIWETWDGAAPPPKAPKKECDTTPGPPPTPPSVSASTKSLTTLTNWWKVTNIMTNESYCTGTDPVGILVSTSAFTDMACERGDVIPGNFVLGDHSADREDQKVDTFGMWPDSMTSGGQADQQFRRHMSEPISTFASRLTMTLSGSKLDHMSCGHHLFNTVKMINAVEIHKHIKKQMKDMGEVVADDVALTSGQIAALEDRHCIPRDLVEAAERVANLRREMKDAANKVNDILNFKDINRCMQPCLQKAEQLPRGVPHPMLNPSELMRMRFRSLYSCEQRAAQKKSEDKILQEANRTSASEHIQGILQRQCQSLEMEIENENTTLQRLTGYENSLRQEMVECERDIGAARDEINRAFKNTGVFDSVKHHQHDRLVDLRTKLKDDFDNLQTLLKRERDTQKGLVAELTKIRSTLARPISKGGDCDNGNNPNKRQRINWIGDQEYDAW